MPPSLYMPGTGLSRRSACSPKSGAETSLFLPTYNDGMPPRSRLAVSAVILILLAKAGTALNLGNAAVVPSPNLIGPEQKAVAMLIDEIEKRTRIRLSTSDRWPDSGPAIFVGRAAGLSLVAPPAGPPGSSLVPAVAGAEG
jgi:hypothetical protein